MYIYIYIYFWLVDVLPLSPSFYTFMSTNDLLYDMWYPLSRILFSLTNTLAQCCWLQPTHSFSMWNFIFFIFTYVKCRSKKISILFFLNKIDKVFLLQFVIKANESIIYFFFFFISLWLFGDKSLKLSKSFLTHEINFYNILSYLIINISF